MAPVKPAIRLPSDEELLPRSLVTRGQVRFEQRPVA